MGHAHTFIHKYMHTPKAQISKHTHRSRAPEAIHCFLADSEDRNARIMRKCAPSGFGWGTKGLICVCGCCSERDDFYYLFDCVCAFKFPLKSQRWYKMLSWYIWCKRWLIFCSVAFMWSDEIFVFMSVGWLRALSLWKTFSVGHSTLVLPLMHVRWTCYILVHL